MHEKFRNPGQPRRRTKAAPGRGVFLDAKWRSSAAAAIPGCDSIEDPREFPGEIRAAAERKRAWACVTPYLPSFGFSACFGVSAGFVAGAAPSFGAGAGAFAGSGGLGRPLYA
jgi:hypothetical protein